MRDPRTPVGDGELIPIDQAGALAKYDDEAFALATKAGDYLPRLQLMTSNSDACKAGEFPVNHYALVRGKDLRDLGESVDVLVVAWRPKALEIGDAILAVYDPKSMEFIRIQEKSAEQNSGCMYGPEFLIYIPSISEWATFFMGSKSSRNEAANMRTRMHKAATMASQKLSNKKFTWFSPLINSCTTPFALPTIEDIKKEAEKFNNPPLSEVEVDESTGSRER